ncbi:hypothetical protein CLF_106423 [Clonorchis sinensis]|uniref:C2H2-type domain-containing protein n=1 Tax=Clonorchis sinensis TaxID=79923 RepID=G7YPX9_CLOSI|nr:hypothetical protein CLF_106423 [Clonorchis sinensis]
MAGIDREHVVQENYSSLFTLSLHKEFYTTVLYVQTFKKVRFRVTDAMSPTYIGQLIRKMQCKEILTGRRSESVEVFTILSSGFDISKPGVDDGVKSNQDYQFLLPCKTRNDPRRNFIFTGSGRRYDSALYGRQLGMTWCATRKGYPIGLSESRRNPDHLEIMSSLIAATCACKVPVHRKVDRTAAQIEVKNILQGGGYPTSLIKHQLRRGLVPVAKPKIEWLGTVVIPYKPGTSEIIRRILNTTNIRVAFQRGNTLRLALKGNTLRSALVQLKDRLPANRTRDCVYKIKCSECTKLYVGQTAMELHTRIGEHKRKINRSLRNADDYRALLKDSAIAEHALDTGHKIDLKNV